MSFLDNNGLSYFYQKLKGIFVRSVNSKTPDAVGNIDITNVATADNLTSPDAQGSYDYFVYRTSGGSASLSSGEAELVYVDGNMEINNRVPENFAIQTNNGVAATYSASIWKQYLSDPVSGTYLFTYTKPTSSVAASSWTSSGSWNFTPASGSAVSNVNPESYGIYVSNVVNPSVSISVSGTGILGATVVPNTWFSAMSASGSYNFTYYVPNLQEDPTGVEGWYLNEELVTLADYGIVVSGTAAKDDTITISSVVGTPNSTVRVDYTKYSPGTIVIPTPTKFSATGFNQFDKNTMYIADANISGGKIASNAGTYVCYCRAVGGVTNGYVAFSGEGYISNIGWCATLPAIGSDVVTTGAAITSTLSSIPFDDNGYVVVVVSDMDDLCVHPKWSGSADEDFAEYVAPSEIDLPTEDIEGTDIPIGTWGMAAVGAIADRLNLEAGTYVQRIDRLANTTSNMSYVVGLETPYEYDNNYIYYVLPNPITYMVDVDPTYIVNDWGTEEFTGTTVALGAHSLYGQNLRDKLRTDVLTISTQTPPLSEAQTEQVYKNLGLHSFHLNGTITSLPFTIEDERITSRSSVVNVVLGTSSAITSDLTWTTGDGIVVFSGTLASSASTTIEFDIAPIITAVGQWNDNVMPDSGDGYCKFPDGTLIQWGRTTTSASGMTLIASSGIYYGHTSIAFPIGFVGEPIVVGSTKYATGHQVPAGFAGNTTGADVSYYDFYQRSGSPLVIRWVANGRWK